MKEQFSYSLMASGLGILIVFTILVLLSLLMLLIKKFSDTDTTNKSPSVKTAAPKRAVKASDIPLQVLVAVAAAETGAGTNSPDWVGAAVSAYIASEEDDAVAPRATSWAAAGAGKYDPWVANYKLTKTAPGA